MKISQRNFELATSFFPIQCYSALPEINAILSTMLDNGHSVKYNWIRVAEENLWCSEKVIHVEVSPVKVDPARKPLGLMKNYCVISSDDMMKCHSHEGEIWTFP